MTARQRARWAVTSNPPAGWGLLFARVPGRSLRVRCLLCGRDGYGFCGKTIDRPGVGGYQIRPAPWQAQCILGHPVRCPNCRRPFTSNTALGGHLTCKLHHDCCRDHTTVPAWKNAFREAS